MAIGHDLVAVGRVLVAVGRVLAGLLRFFGFGLVFTFIS
jgi:hypothetical protein